MFAHYLHLPETRISFGGGGFRKYLRAWRDAWRAAAEAEKNAIELGNVRRDRRARRVFEASYDSNPSKK